jgi:hypothetical protein
MGAGSENPLTTLNNPAEGTMSGAADTNDMTHRRTSISAVRPCPHCGTPSTMTVIGVPDGEPPRADVQVLFHCPRHCRPSEHAVLRLANDLTRD